jgi:hypothetical protein
MVQATYTTTFEDERAIFSPLPQPPFVVRLWRALKIAAREFARSPLAYLRAAFLPERTADWLPMRLASAVSSFVRHPLKGLGGLLHRDRIPVGFIDETAGGSATFVTNALSPSQAEAKGRAWDRFGPVLMASGAAHGVLIGVLVYLTIANMLAPYANVRIVNKPYRPFSSDQVAELYARSRPITQPKPTDQVLSLEELRERERKRREERERHRAEEEARLKAAREKAEREARAAEEKAKAEEAAKAASGDGAPKFGEINEAAIKDLVGKIYKRYQAGEIELNNFSVMAAFKIDCDGSMPRSSIRIVQSSGDAKKDDLALQILWLIGESHALGPLCKLSSNTIRFDLGEDTTRLSITGFGPNPEWTAQQAKTLRTMFWTLATFKGKTDTGELAKYIKVNTVNNRIDVDLSLSRARASEMMRARFGGNP